MRHCGDPPRAREAFPFTRAQTDACLARTGGVICQVAGRAAGLYEKKRKRARLYGQTGRIVSVLAAATLFASSVWMPRLPEGGAEKTREFFLLRMPPPDAAPTLPSGNGTESEKMLGLEWIKTRDRAAYTIEVVRLFNLASVHRFHQLYSPHEPTACYPARPGGPFVVIVGAYPDRNQTRAALERLSGPLKGFRLIPRRFAEIHAELTP